MTGDGTGQDGEEEAGEGKRVRGKRVKGKEGMENEDKGGIMGGKRERGQGKTKINIQWQVLGKL